MPDLINRCTKSTCNHAGDHPVRFIAEDNLTNYVSVPDHVQAKVCKGLICFAHYTDVIRMLLLAEYGGLWVDADLFTNKTIPEAFFTSPFSTECNDLSCIPAKEALRYPSKGTWSIQILGGWKGNTFTCFVRDALIEYWERNDAAMEHLLLDYMLEIARRELDGVEEALQRGSVFNGRHRLLNQEMRRAQPSTCYQYCLPDETIFNTLNWKNDYPLLTPDGRNALFSAFLDNPALDQDTYEARR